MRMNNCAGISLVKTMAARALSVALSFVATLSCLTVMPVGSAFHARPPRSVKTSGSPFSFCVMGTKNEKAGFVSPMLLRLVPKLPEGEERQYEVNWDGYRGIALIDRGKAKVWSRNERDLSKRFPMIVEGLEKLAVKSAVLDGEVVVLDEEGKPSFQALQHLSPKNARNVFYYAFDLMHLDGMDLKHLPLDERHERLAELLAEPPAEVRLSSTLEGEPDVLIPIIRSQGLEGIVAKDRSSFYEAGKRTGKWQKFKLYVEEEFWIGGFIRDGKGAVESVVLGVPEDDRLRYVACLDVRLPLKESRGIAAKLERLILPGGARPFGEIPKRRAGDSWSGGMTEEELSIAIWAKPRLKAEVHFLEWTAWWILATCAGDEGTCSRKTRVQLNAH
jgi:bifunctional non-homologous end joining protein LigD